MVLCILISSSGNLSNPNQPPPPRLVTLALAFSVLNPFRGGDHMFSREFTCIIISVEKYDNKHVYSHFGYEFLKRGRNAELRGGWIAPNKILGSSSPPCTSEASFFLTDIHPVGSGTPGWGGGGILGAHPHSPLPSRGRGRGSTDLKKKTVPRARLRIRRRAAALVRLRRRFLCGAVARI